MSFGEHSVGLAVSSHAVLTGDGNSQFVTDTTLGYSRGNASTSFTEIGLEVNPFIFNVGGSFDFAPYLQSGGGSPGQMGR